MELKITQMVQKRVRRFYTRHEPLWASYYVRVHSRLWVYNNVRAFSAENFHSQSYLAVRLFFGSLPQFYPNTVIQQWIKYFLIVKIGILISLLNALGFMRDGLCRQTINHTKFVYCHPAVATDTFADIFLLCAQAHCVIVKKNIYIVIRIFYNEQINVLDRLMHLLSFP